MTAPRVLAFDLSLTAAGACDPAGGVSTLRPPGRGAARLDWCFDAVSRLVVTHTPDLVAVEGYAFGRANQAHQLGELGGVVRLALHIVGQRWAAIPPAMVKKYATGKGNAGKPEVVASAIRRLGYEGHDDNQADALWLRAVVMDALGHPVVDVPAAHRDVLDKVRAILVDAYAGTEPVATS